MTELDEALVDRWMDLAEEMSNILRQLDLCTTTGGTEGTFYGICTDPEKAKAFERVWKQLEGSYWPQAYGIPIPGDVSTAFVQTRLVDDRHIISKRNAYMSIRIGATERDCTEQWIHLKDLIACNLKAMEIVEPWTWRVHERLAKNLKIGYEA